MRKQVQYVTCKGPIKPELEYSGTNQLQLNGTELLGMEEDQEQTVIQGSVFGQKLRFNETIRIILYRIAMPYMWMVNKNTVYSITCNNSIRMQKVLREKIPVYRKYMSDTIWALKHKLESFS